MTYCEIYLKPEVYQGIDRVRVVADTVDERNGWFCFWNEEWMVACFNRETVNGWMVVSEKQSGVYDYKGHGKWERNE